jgi:hypothetical protein
MLPDLKTAQEILHQLGVPREVPELPNSLIIRIIREAQNSDYQHRLVPKEHRHGLSPSLYFISSAMFNQGERRQPEKWEDEKFPDGSGWFDEFVTGFAYMYFRGHIVGWDGKIARSHHIRFS